MRTYTPPHTLDDEEEILEEVLDDEDIHMEEDDDLDELRNDELENNLENYEEDEEEEDPQEAQRILSIRDDAKLTFCGHDSPIFCCCFHPQHSWAVTGAQDDRVLIWNIETGETIHELNDYKDTVTGVQFNHDGTYLASGDLSGELFLHKIVESQNGQPTFEKIWEYSMGDMTWLRWHHRGNVLFAGSESGEIYMWHLPKGDCKILPGQSERCETAELTCDGKMLLAAYRDASVKLWNLGTGAPVMEIKSDQHLALQNGCFAVACHNRDPVYACGDTEGKIIICTNNGVVGSMQANKTVECLGFSPALDSHLLASGTLEGQIAIWDYSKYSQRIFCNNPDPTEGILRLKWLDEFNLLVTTQFGSIHGFDTRSGILMFTLTGHFYAIYEMAYKAEDNKLLTVSEDSTAKIFNLPMLGD